MDIWRPKIISARVFAEGARLPRGYGVAWWLPHIRAAYCLPVPFNRLAGWMRLHYLRWQQPQEDDPIMGAHRLGYQEGYRAGRQQGEEVTTRRLDAIEAAIRYATRPPHTRP